MIYAIYDQPGMAVKIGMTTDVPKRLATLQTGHPNALTILGTMPGDRQEESILHNTFTRFRIRGEWFHAHPDLLAGLAKLFAREGVVRTVAQELERRQKCRYGLRGVSVLLRGEGESLYRIVSSSWGRSGLQLTLVEESDWLDFVGWEADRKDPISADPRAEFSGLVLRRVDPTDCLLASTWPVICRCWVEETEE